MSDEHHPEQIAHDAADIRADVAYERDQLDASIKHDYSTTEVGVVPLDKRRPMWHFMGLWTTFVAGFSYMFLGFEIRDDKIYALREYMDSHYILQQLKLL